MQSVKNWEREEKTTNREKTTCCRREKKLRIQIIIININSDAGLTWKAILVIQRWNIVYKIPRKCKFIIAWEKTKYTHTKGNTICMCVYGIHSPYAVPSLNLVTYALQWVMDGFHCIAENKHKQSR